METRGVTKLFLRSVESARVELYFTNRSAKPLFARYLARNCRSRTYRFGRLCIGILGRNFGEPPAELNTDLLLLRAVTGHRSNDKDRLHIGKIEP